MTVTLFLHGLDSSSLGTKGRFFAKNFPQVLRPDFHGDLAQRLRQLAEICAGHNQLVLIGSSFGGLMATCHAIRHPEQVSRLILLAPALNFADFEPPPTPIGTPTLLVMGNQDTVCPPSLVEPLARATFSELDIRSGNDDHFLRRMFRDIDWNKELTCK